MRMYVHTNTLTIAGQMLRIAESAIVIAECLCQVLHSKGVQFCVTDTSPIGRSTESEYSTSTMASWSS